MIRYSIEEACRLQGWPELAAELAAAPFTKDGKLKLIANGVPAHLGRAIAGAVMRAMTSHRAKVPQMEGGTI